MCGLLCRWPPDRASARIALRGLRHRTEDHLPELLDRPRPWIARYHPVDRCCDEARRMADVLTLHAVAGMAGRFTLVKLLDGSAVDQIATYGSREEAERYKNHPAQIAVLIPPGGLAAAECEEVLHYHRDLYDKLGSRPLEVGYIMPLTRRDQRRQLRILARGRK